MKRIILSILLLMIVSAIGCIAFAGPNEKTVEITKYDKAGNYVVISGVGADPFLDVNIILRFDEISSGIVLTQNTVKPYRNGHFHAVLSIPYGITGRRYVVQAKQIASDGTLAYSQPHTLAITSDETVQVSSVSDVASESSNPSMAIVFLLGTSLLGRGLYFLSTME